MAGIFLHYGLASTIKNQLTLTVAFKDRRPPAVPEISALADTNRRAWMLFNKLVILGNNKTANGVGANGLELGKRRLNQRAIGREPAFLAVHHNRIQLRCAHKIFEALARHPVTELINRKVGGPYIIPASGFGAGKKNESAGKNSGGKNKNLFHITLLSRLRSIHQAFQSGSPAI